MRSSRSALICTKRHGMIARMRRAIFMGLVVALLCAGNGAVAGAAETGAANPWPSTVVAGAFATAHRGSWAVRANGAVSGTHLHGDARRQHLAQPIVGMAATPSGNGYWLVAADGGV